MLLGHCFEPYPVQQGMAAPRAGARLAECGDAERRQQELLTLRGQHTHPRHGNVGTRHRSWGKIRRDWAKNGIEMGERERQEVQGWA